MSFVPEALRCLEEGELPKPLLPGGLYPASTSGM